MSKNEGAGFRRRLFGGFNNNDVIEYIANASRTWKNEKETLERQLADTEKRAVASKTELVKYKAENLVLTSNVEKLSASLSENMTKLSEVTKQAELLSAKNERLEAELALAKDASLKLEETEKKLCETESENSRLSSELAAATDELLTLKEALAKANERLTELETENKDLNSRSDSLKNFAEGIASMLAGLNGENK